MTSVNKARFTISSTPSTNLGYDAAPGEVLTLALESTADVLSVTYQTYDVADSSSPLASSGSPSFVFSNALNSITPTTPATAATATATSSAIDSHSWIFRATAVTANGNHVFERMVTLKMNKPRKYVPGETTQYSVRGWGDAIDDLIASFNSYYIPPRITTSAAGAASFADMPTPARATGIYVSAVFMATQQNTPNNTIFWFVEAAYATDTGNTLTQRIAPATVKKKDLSAGSLVIGTDPSFSIVSNKLRPGVTGIAATTIFWTLRMDLFVTTAL